MTMNTIHVARMYSDEHPTIGVVQVRPEKGQGFQCFSLEDRFRSPAGPKVLGDTRIPGGTYHLRWRKVGRFAKRWQARGFPGSLQLRLVPGFEYILIHAGNTKADTAGCILMGMSADLETRTIGKSRKAVRHIYELVAAHKGPWMAVVQ